MPEVKFVDLGRQYLGLRDEILAAFDKVSRTGTYVLGEEVEQFEAAFAAYCGVRHAISMGNGSDALFLPLLSLGIGPGDEVITAPNSFVASAWVIARTGARIVFADVGDDMNLAPEAVARAITPRTKAILVVHLTGRIARMEELARLAAAHRIPIIEDAAQAVGARRHGARAGSFGHCAGFSLHPLKNLHVHGDGGICVTNDDSLATHLRQYRNHGLANRNDCLFWGINTRLDTIQAAIALLKLPRLDSWNARHRAIAAHYRAELAGVVQVPTEESFEEPIYHRFMVRCDQRDALRDHLQRLGVATAINYPVPLHLQPAARDLGYGPGAFPVAEKLARTILSLPIFPELRDEEVEQVVAGVKSFIP